MPYLNWNENFSVNVEKIDAEHKRLVGMINELYECIMNRTWDSANTAKSVVFKMIDYAATHFKTEEYYMNLYNFAGYPDHKQEHEKFLEKALDLKLRLESGRVILSLEILDFLRDWLKNHILGTDKKYTKCFNENGLF